NLIGGVTANPYSLVWSNVALGNYTVTARAADNRGATTLSSPIDLTVVSGLTFTDNFAARNTVTGSPLTISGSNANNTSAEPGEPNPTGLRNTRTVWIAWTATYSSPVTVDT